MLPGEKEIEKKRFFFYLQDSQDHFLDTCSVLRIIEEEKKKAIFKTPFKHSDPISIFFLFSSAFARKQNYNRRDKSFKL